MKVPEISNDFKRTPLKFIPKAAYEENVEERKESVTTRATQKEGEVERWESRSEGIKSGRDDSNSLMVFSKGDHTGTVRKELNRE